MPAAANARLRHLVMLIPLFFRVETDLNRVFEPGSDLKFRSSLARSTTQNCQSCPHEWVLAHFIAQTGLRPVPGNHGGVLVQAVQALLDRTLYGRVIAAPQSVRS